MYLPKKYNYTPDSYISSQPIDILVWISRSLNHFFNVLWVIINFTGNARKTKPLDHITDKFSLYSRPATQVQSWDLINNYWCARNSKAEVEHSQQWPSLCNYYGTFKMKVAKHSTTPVVEYWSESFWNCVLNVLWFLI